MFDIMAYKVRNLYINTKRAQLDLYKCRLIIMLPKWTYPHSLDAIPLTLIDS
jgi:hypothetical protein